MGANKSPERRGHSIVVSVVWNFVGNGAPLLVALLTIPAIVHGLGTERFGALTIAWVVMGYFGLFDLGLGRATTRAVAESIERGERDRLPGVIATSTGAHMALGLTGGLTLALLTSWVAGTVLNMPAALRAEVNTAFYFLALSVPVIVVTSAPRGVLEALGRFDLVNAIKTPASIATYLIPLIVLQWTTALGTIVLAIAVVRVVVLVAYSILCLREIPISLHSARIDVPFARGLFRYGWWLMVPSMLAPAIASADRFIIGSVVSLSAVAWYATPYEIVSRLWILSGSVLAVLFPAFSAIGAARSEELRAVSYRAVRSLTVLGTLPVLIMIAFADVLLEAWLGRMFAMESAPAARILAIGMLISVVAQVPFTTLQSVGYARSAAWILLGVLPFYAMAGYFGATRWGIAGVAAAWSGRVAIEGSLMFAREHHLLYRHTRGLKPFRWITALIVVSAMVWLAWQVAAWTLAYRVLVLGVTTLAFGGWAWLWLFDSTDRSEIRRRVRMMMRL